MCYELQNPYFIWHSSTLEAIRVRRDIITMSTLDPQFHWIQSMFHTPDSKTKRALRRSNACMREIFMFVGPAAFQMRALSKRMAAIITQYPLTFIGINPSDIKRRQDPMTLSFTPHLQPAALWQIISLWLMRENEDHEDPEIWKNKPVFYVADTRAKYAPIRADAMFMNVREMEEMDKAINAIRHIGLRPTTVNYLFRADLD